MAVAYTTTDETTRWHWSTAHCPSDNAAREDNTVIVMHAPAWGACSVTMSLLTNAALAAVVRAGGAGCGGGLGQVVAPARDVGAWRRGGGGVKD